VFAPLVVHIHQDDVLKVEEWMQKVQKSTMSAVEVADLAAVVVAVAVVAVVAVAAAAADPTLAVEGPKPTVGPSLAQVWFEWT